MRNGSQEVVRVTKQVPLSFCWLSREETPRYFVEMVWARTRLNKATVVPWWIQRSIFLTLCLFLDGLLITLIGFEWKVPMGVPWPDRISTWTWAFLRFSSAPLTCNCLDTQLPIRLLSWFAKRTAEDWSNRFPSLYQSIVPWWLSFSPEIWIVRLGGYCFAVHQWPVPERIVEGGGHKNLLKRMSFKS